MNSIQEISTDKNIPFKLFLHNLTSISTHCHNSYELLFVLSGTATVTIDDRTHRLEEEDMIVINPNQLHELHSGNCVMVVLQMNPELFMEEAPEEAAPFFLCNSSETQEIDAYYKLKVLIAKLIKTTTDSADHNHLIAKSLLLNLMDELLKNFSTTSPRSMTSSRTNNDRILKILNYIGENYAEDITLAKLSKQEFLSPSYLSRYIEKELGTSFKTHLTNIRLIHGFNDLCTTKDTISAIAARNGFPNTRAFVTAFRKKYDSLPSNYRKGLVMSTGKATGKSDDIDLPLEYTEVAKNNHLSRLNKYLKDDFTPSIAKVKSFNLITLPPLDIRKSQQALTRDFRRIITLGRSSDVLEKKTQDMLIVLQKSIGFKHVQLTGLFGRDILDYFTDDQLVDGFNFDKIDDVIDFLLTIKLKPMFKLGFEHGDSRLITDMIQGRGDSKVLLKKWQHVVTIFVGHLMERYGRDEVTSWLFTMQEEADSLNLSLQKSNEARYHQFYHVTWHAVKSVNHGLQFGPSPILPYMLKGMDLLDHFISYCTSHNVVPDFFSFKFYPVDFTDSAMIKGTLRLSSDQDALKTFIRAFKEKLKENRMSHLPLYMTQWNATVSNSDPLNDTCFKSAYITKNIVDNIGQVDSFGYWLLSDDNSLHQPGHSLFHGGLGLFTKNGLKKASFNAYWLLGKMGTHLIDKGEGYMISKRKHDLQILLFNYQHYSDMYAQGLLYDQSCQKPYSPFPTAQNKTFELELSHMTPGTYIRREYALNRQHGSSYDLWAKHYTAPITDPEELALLKAHSEPMLTKSYLEVTQQQLPLSYTLEPHEVKLITMTLT